MSSAVLGIMLERFICVFGIDPNPQIIDKIFKELILFTARAMWD